MPERSAGGTFRVEVGTRTDRAAEAAPDHALHIALLGDFSGRCSRGDTAATGSVATRTPMMIDRDNFDDVLARVCPSLTLASPDEPEGGMSLQFADLEDFHPDRLYARLPLFRALRLARDRLADPRGVADSPGEPTPRERGSAPGHPLNPTALAAPSALLDQIVDQASGDAVGSDGGGLDDFIRSIVAPHLVPQAGARQIEALDTVDAEIAAQMRKLLHHPGFRALEALWRGVFLLCRRLETGPDLKLFLVDVSKAELLADQAPEVALQESDLYRLLVEPTVGTLGAVPWGLLVGCYSFGPGIADVNLLGRLAAIAGLTGAPWLSAAEASAVGTAPFGDVPDPWERGAEADSAWHALRRLPQSPWLGLVAPRILLRLPYGRDTVPCDLLRFEETEARPAHEDYLWGNAALVAALLAAAAFVPESGARHGRNLEVGGLPLHAYRIGGEVRVQPCAEVHLTERTAFEMLERGIMPLVWIKDTDRVRLLRFQSVADPPSGLAGGLGGEGVS